MCKGIAYVGLIAALMAGAAYADISECPKVSDIKATTYIDPDDKIPDEFRSGFQYTAPSAVSGKTWHGETIATDETFLESKYELKAETINTTESETVCSYGGKSVTLTVTDDKGNKKEATSTPYLKMILDK